MSNETTVAKAAPPPAKVSVLNALAAKLECDPEKMLPLLKKTAFASCTTNEEFMAMCMVANTYGLNPILSEIYAFPNKGKVVPVVGVDGWVKMMNSNPQFDGIEFRQDDEKCTAVVYRKDRNHPITATEWLSECRRNTEPWSRWPRRMLRHKAMIQAARIAFGFAGIYDEDEKDRIVEASAADAPVAERSSGKDALKAALSSAAPKGQVVAQEDETPQQPVQDDLPEGDGMPDDVPL